MNAFSLWQRLQQGWRQQPLAVLYGSLAILASGAATKAMVWPLWPKAQELQPLPIQQALRQAGIAVQPLAAGPPTRSVDLATSTVQTFSLGNGQELRLMNATVRERFNLQTAFVGRVHAETKLERRQAAPQEGPSFTGSHQQRLSRQTCLVLGSAGGLGTTRDQLTPLTDRLAAQQRQRSWQVLLGLQSNRDYRCTLISVRSGPGQPVIAPGPWQSLLTTLQASLNRAGGDG